jgi:transcriptional regulator GlxA family with amidase domain
MENTHPNNSFNSLQPAMVAETFVSLAEALVSKKQLEKSRKSSLQIGVLIFDGFDPGETFGLLEMFNALKEDVSISLIAGKRGVITSSTGTIVMVDYNLTDLPGLDLLMIPSDGKRPKETIYERFLQGLRRLAAASTHVAAFATGAVLLARTGILDGSRAAVCPDSYDYACCEHPNVLWDAVAEWLADGKFFTSAGIPAGRDMALALVSRLSGPKTAEHASGSALTNGSI